jgi:alkylhydroperoxidase family enzyme
VTRIKKLPIDQWDAELRAMQAADSASEVELGMFRVLAHTPALAKAVTRFGGELFGARTLSRRLVELVRLRVAFHNQCRSCMAIRYNSAIDDGLTEGAVCSLARPQEAEDLSPAEKAALAYADRSSTDHFAIDEADFDKLRNHFSEAQIVELGVFIAFFIGFGRLSAAWAMTEDLPEGYTVAADRKVAPWEEAALAVRG